MKINEEFSIKKDKYNFILVRTSKGINPDTNKPFSSESNKYYPTIELACLAVISDGIETESMQTIIDTITQAKTDVLEAIKAAKGTKKK